MNKSISPGVLLLNQVRAGFISRGSTLHRWCLTNGVLYPNARQALMGGWNDPKGALLRELIIRESGIVLGGDKKCVG
ncbi:hypothetical protein FQW28_02590 [Salmonella enterica]|nr:hypothetical protein [Salmonella enterica]